MDYTRNQPPASIPSPQPPTAPTSDERNLGMLCHLLGIITGYTLGLGFLGPLVLWLMKKDSSPFIDHHGKEALNFQLTVMLALLCLGAVTFILMFFVIGVLLIPVLVILGIIALVIEILACIAAHRGEWYRYPFSIRFIS